MQRPQKGFDELGEKTLAGLVSDGLSNQGGCVFTCYCFSDGPARSKPVARRMPHASCLLASQPARPARADELEVALMKPHEKLQTRQRGGRLTGRQSRQTCGLFIDPLYYMSSPDSRGGHKTSKQSAEGGGNTVLDFVRLQLPEGVVCRIMARNLP